MWPFFGFLEAFAQLAEKIKDSWSDFRYPESFWGRWWAAAKLLCLALLTITLLIALALLPYAFTRQ